MGQIFESKNISFVHVSEFLVNDYLAVSVETLRRKSRTYFLK